MPGLPYEAYLFDADGTLFDTRELIRRSFAALFEDIGRPPPDRDAVDAGTGLVFAEHARRLLGDVPKKEWSRCLNLYRSRQAELMALSPPRLFPGVVEGLAELRRRGAKLAVVTSRMRPSLEVFLALTGLSGAFDALVTPEDTDRHKPDPAPVVKALEKLSAPAGRAVMVGDAAFDIEAGSRAGTATILVAWGGMDPAAFPVAPDRVVERFAELLE